jgi:hypothetical protein
MQNTLGPIVVPPFTGSRVGSALGVASFQSFEIFLVIGSNVRSRDGS